MLKTVSIYRIAFLFVFIALAGSGLVLCQTQNAAAATDVPQDEIGHDIQAYLLLASSDPVGKNKVPTSLENVTKQLTAFLGPNNYNLVARYIYRVKDGGSIEASGVDTFGMLSPAATAARPAFYGFRFDAVSFIANKGQPIIQIRSMKFSMSVPIAFTVNAGTKDAVDNVQYRDVSIITQLNLPEGIPTVVGTMSTNQPDKLLILVLMAKRSQIK